MSAMSMGFVPMPGQSWPAAAATFLGMWSGMMVVMMLPALGPMLWSYRRAVTGSIGGAKREGLTLLVGLGYFFIWTVIGAVLYPLGMAVKATEMHVPAVAWVSPVVGAMLVVGVGLFQFTKRKVRSLECCRSAPAAALVVPANARTAWRHGLRLGVHCSKCCGGLMTLLLVVGIMDLQAMALVTIAIAAERLAPNGEAVARAVGVGTVVVGLGLATAALFG
jgi:predicted metal-binding membrane protein